jgi:glutathione-regulated potassium-efflux system ancillary protein KefC
VSDSILFQALVYLAAAVICVPIAKRIKLGSVLGYLIAGVILGPTVLGVVGGGANLMHFAELGVVMMLFLVGLELKPSLLWELRRPIFGLGGLQVAGTAITIGGIAIALGVDWRLGLAVGLIFAMSSTAIVLQTLAEKGMLKTAGGQASFSILLFQDVAVIPILAVFPLLAIAVVKPIDDAHHGASPDRPGWMQALLILGAVALIVLAGRFLVRPALRFLAETRLREVFTASALLLVVAIAWLMTIVGLSPALGTFLAGVVLADSEYRHELESDIEPFKGLLLGLFFISVGVDIDFGLLLQRPGAILGMLFGTIVIKTIVIFTFGKVLRLDRPARWLAAVGLSQIGEFAFVLISFGVQNGVFGEEVSKPLAAVVALSMLATPALFILLERVILPRATAKAMTRENDAVSHDDAEVVMAGFGRVGQVIGRVLRMSGHSVTVLDLDPEMVDLLRRLDTKVYYGDASRLDLLIAAGCAKAKLFILAVDDPVKSLEIAELVRRNFPNLPIIARTRNRTTYYELRKLGIEQVFRETLGSSVEIGEAALRHLGVRGHTAHRLGRKWREGDKTSIERMLEFMDAEDDVWLAEAKKALANTEKAMREEILGTSDLAWNNETLRAEVQKRQNPPTSD